MMARCKWCDNSGFFLSVGENGLCKPCDQVFIFEARQRIRISNESLEIAGKSKKIDTAISRYEIAAEHLQFLLRYEQKGVPTINPLPSEILKKIPKLIDSKIIETYQEEFEKISNSDPLGTSLKQKFNSLNKLYNKFLEHKDKFRDPLSMVSFETTLKEALYKTKLSLLMEDANKEEFKKKYKKAKDLYYEALYFVKNDHIEDGKQTEVINNLEQKISEIENNIKSK